MKTLSKFLLFAVIATLGVSMFAAPENHEAFAREYMPESQAVLERFENDYIETIILRSSLAKDLRVMNRDLNDDSSYRAVLEKSRMLSQKREEWNDLLKDAFLKHKAGMISSEKLSETDAELAKEFIAWEQNTLNGVLKKIANNYDSPIMVKIPEKNHYIAKFVVSQALYGAITGLDPSYTSTPSQKVDDISWYEAIEFCKKLTKRDRILGRISENQKYCLPELGELYRAVDDKLVVKMGAEWTSTDWEGHYGTNPSSSALYGRGWLYGYAHNDGCKHSKKYGDRDIGFRVILVPSGFFSDFFN